MTSVYYEKNEAYLDGVRLVDVATEFGTPSYVYSRQTFEDNWLSFDRAFGDFPHHISYAVKANSNLSILSSLAKLGSGFDIVSVGELERVLVAGGEAKQVIFSGVGKQEQEITRALEVGIHCFNVESESELERIAAIAQRLNKVAPIALRVNPNIDAQTHPYISTGLKDNKFGIEIESLQKLLAKIKSSPQLNFCGLASHIGSQLVSLSPFIETMTCLRDLYLNFTQQGFKLKHIDIGGGLGVRYRNETPPTREAYVEAVKKVFSDYPLEIILEPGRAIIAEAGIILTRIEYLKPTSSRNFVVVDAAMNDYLRPALYDAWQEIIPLKRCEGQALNYDLVGPVCESADFLGRDRRLQVAAGDYLAILTTGAYGFSMSSNYNSRVRPAEVLIAEGKTQLIRRRETIAELYAAELL